MHFELKNIPLLKQFEQSYQATGITTFEYAIQSAMLLFIKTYRPDYDNAQTGNTKSINTKPQVEEIENGFDTRTIS